MKTGTLDLPKTNEKPSFNIGLVLKTFSKKIWDGLKPKSSSKVIFTNLFYVSLSIMMFFMFWYFGAKALYNIEANALIEAARKEGGDAAALKTSQCIYSGDLACKPNALPSPADVWNAGKSLYKDHQVLAASKAKFYTDNAALNAQLKAAGQKTMIYTGRSSFIDKALKSLFTVFAGVLLSMFIAIPIGILVGLNANIKSMFNWIIQIFKPVSPVVWFLLVYMVVKTVSKSINMDKSFMISLISVSLCSMWATLVNTSVGVASVDKDYINVANVLQLGFFKRIFKIIIPSAMPMIFTGLRVTVSVAWMVLIAIELLAQSPGLGSFVWEEFQNGANDSNSKIIFAMFVIGIIGFMLDKIMLAIQHSLSYTK